MPSTYIDKDIVIYNSVSSTCYVYEPQIEKKLLICDRN